jgi:hypothetical protein
MECKPPLMGLAELNKVHWQSDADQRHILTVGRFPILACSGAGKDPQDPITIGPNKILYIQDAQGRYYYVEHTGAAIEAGRKDMQDLEARMANYGAEFLKVKPGTQTATEKSIDTSEATSELQTMVALFVDAMAVALSYTADWLGLGRDGGTVEINTEWSAMADNNGNDLTVLREARAKKDISQAQYLTQLKERGILSESFDVEANGTELAAESLVLTAPDLTALLALEQGEKISFTELRDILRKARIATQKDEAAKEEIDSAMPNGPGVVGATGFPLKVEGVPPADLPPTGNTPTNPAPSAPLGE